MHCEPAPLGTQTQRSKQVCWYQVHLTTPAPPAVRFAYGYASSPVVGLFAVLLTVLLAPVLLTLWMRRVSLRAPSANRAGIWFGYNRFLTWTILATVVAWLVVADSLSLKNVVRFLAQSAGLPREFPLSFLEGILFWLPPMLVAILCQTLSHPVTLGCAKVPGRSAKSSTPRLGVWPPLFCLW